MLVIISDFNAQIGLETFLKNVAGKYTLHTKTYDNGKLLSELAKANNFIINSICFNHKRIHKGTWTIPGSEQTHQIDHVLVSGRHGSSILDVKTARGPNSDSDHYLVKVKIKNRLATIENNVSYKRQNGKLTNERNQNSLSYIRKQ
jgi:endonuclease/exonuclease/phosphatase family metal-dependent hydrolase